MLKKYKIPDLKRKKNFDFLLKLSGLWVNKGDELLISVEILKTHSEFDKYILTDTSSKQPSKEMLDNFAINRTTQMLKAMALECYLKALWLYFGNKLSITSGEYKRIPGTNDHCLETIANAIEKKNNFHFSSDEKNFLSRISAYITLGRYHIPKKYNNFDNLPIPSGVRMATKGSVIMSTKGDEKLFKNIVEKIKEEINKDPRQ